MNNGTIHADVLSRFGGIVLVAFMGCICLEGEGSPVYGQAGAESGENTGLGYLTAPSLSPGHILRPSSLFVLPMLGSKGTDRLDFDFHWGNVCNYRTNQFLIDGEWIRSSFRYSHAVSGGVSVGVAVPIIGRTGGFSDSSIDKFHSAFHLGNASRDQFPRNRSVVTVQHQESVYTVVSGESWGIGDVSAFVDARLTEGTCVLPAITVQGEVSLPTGDQDELRGMGSPAFALSAVASKRLGGSPVITFLGLGYQYCDSDDVAFIKFRDEQYSGLAGVEYQVSRTFGLLVQYLVSSAVAWDYFAFSEPSHEISVGFKWYVGHEGALEVAVVENLFVFENSADIGVHLAYGHTL